ILFLIAIAIAGCATPEPAQTYLVSFSVSENGAHLGEPRILVEARKSASIISSGEDGYELTVIITPLEENSALVSATLKTVTDEMSPTIAVELGKQEKARVGGLELQILATAGPSPDMRLAKYR